MKCKMPIVFFLSAAFSVGFLARAQESAPLDSVGDSERISEMIGSLGIPMGTVANVEAEIVSGRSLGMKKYQSQYLLRIKSVDGKPVSKNVLMEFSSLPFHNVDIAGDNFELYEMKHGKKPKSLSSDEIDALEVGYVGQVFHLVVYELGGFSGIPKNLPDDVQVWQDTGFGFHSWLRVLARRGVNKTDTP